MPGPIDLFLTPPTLEDALTITHTNELVLLDKEKYDGDLPLKQYGISHDDIRSLEDIPPPRANTYVLNMERIAVEEGRVHLHTNYTMMRSQFALRRWTPVLMKQVEEWLKEPQSDYSPSVNFPSDRILRSVLPIGAAMIMETADQQILMEERGKVEIPGKYHPAPAGGCETRDWRVFPEPFRSIKGEAWEETALLPGKDYGDVALIGVARDRTEAFNPAFTYHTKTSLELEKVIQQANSIAPEAGEHQRLFGVPADAEGLLQFCQQSTEKIIGNGLGELLVYGNYKFGPEWLSAASKELRDQGWTINYSYTHFSR